MAACQSLHQQLVLAILSAQSDAQNTERTDRDRAMAIGVNDYLGKPYQESVLLESIAFWSKPHA